MAPSTQNPNMGQVVEYIPDRLYLAAYITPPDENTVFPYPEAPQTRSPTKRSAQRGIVDRPSAVPTSSKKQPLYFSTDDVLLYNAFHHDFGPLHIGHLYRFALQFHEILGPKENQDRPVVFWSRADPRSRANAACLLACYMVLIQSWPPHLALAPIAQVDPPLMPFRDAGYSQADYGITVQDVVYGVWKAKEEKNCVLETFDLDEYERFERVEHGDFNWITPSFLAFASPQHSPVAKVAEGSELWSLLPRTLEAVDNHPTLPMQFKNVLRHFTERNIGLVVRLNSALYSPSYFEALGIRHLDMIFEDGTCPPLATVRRFIRLAHDTITVRKQAIAVHCKAGLGRTGCLIGAYLIYRHGYTANEIIAYMRFMRPGMVVGPQQHWLHLNQGVFREWWIEERVERKLRKEAALAAAEAATKQASSGLPSTPIRAMQKASLGRSHSKNGGTSTPPHRSGSVRTPLGELDADHQARDNKQEDYLPAPTPGQPRKGQSSVGRHHPYSRSTSNSLQHFTAVAEDKDAAQAELEAELTQTHHRNPATGESDEEWHLRMRSSRKGSAAAAQALANSSHNSSTNSLHGRTSSPENKRAISHSHHHTTTVTKTTTVYEALDIDLDVDIGAENDPLDASHDIENIGVNAIGRAKTVDHAQRASSASGVLAKVRGSARRERTGSGVREGGVRKTSGRVGSVSAMAAATTTAAATARKVSGL